MRVGVAREAEAKRAVRRVGGGGGSPRSLSSLSSPAPNRASPRYTALAWSLTPRRPHNSGLAGDATVGGGVFWGGSQGVTFDDFASLGGVAGGPGVGSPRGPATGVVVGRSAGAGPGVWITNANAVGWVGGVFTTAQLSLGKFSVSLSWSSGIWILSATKSLVGPNSKSFSVFTTNTITTGPTCP